MRHKEYLKKQDRKVVEKGKKLIIYRSLSLPISNFLLKTQITANQVTIVSLLLVFLLGFLLSWNTYPLLIASAFLMHFIVLLDYVDGTLARMRGNVSKLGRWLDGIVHHAMEFVLFFCMALGASRIQPQWYVNLLTNLGIIEFRFVLIWVVAFLCVYNFLTITALKDLFIKIFHKGDVFKVKRFGEFGIKKIFFVNIPFYTNFFTIGFLLNQLLLFMFIFAVYTSLYLILEFFYYTIKIKSTKDQTL